MWCGRWGGASVRIRAFLRDTVSGKAAVVYDEWPDSASLDGVEFMWTEGNFSCDCNRGQFLAQVLQEPDPNLPCGDGRIVLDLLLTPAGINLLGVYP